LYKEFSMSKIRFEYTKGDFQSGPIQRERVNEKFQRKFFMGSIPKGEVVRDSKRGSKKPEARSKGRWPA
jgi:hypothetical protein